MPDRVLEITNLSTHIQLSRSVVQAVGNTWIPNVEGADASGHYASQLITTNQSGQNFTTNFTTGGGLQL